MYRGMAWRLVTLVALFGLMTVACSSDDGDGTTQPGNEIVLGAVFHDDVADSARLRIAAVQMAVDEMNAAGVLDSKIKLVNRTPSKGDAADADRAADNAKKLFDEDKAIGVVSLFSSLGKAIIGVTNDAAYADLVQCNCSATNPTMNTPGEEGADGNDTFYRTVVVDTFQGRMMVEVLKEQSWKKVGIYSLDDAFGQGLLAILTEEIGKLSDVTIDVDAKHPTGDFDAQANKATLDEIIAADLDVVILPTLKAQSSGIVKYLTDNGYKGNLLLSDGAKTTDMFQIATGLKAWIDAGHVILGTEPDNFAGKNSDTFSAAFKTKVSEDANTYSPTAYDCAYAIVYAALYAGKEAYTAKGVKANIGKFKEGGRGSDEVEVGLGSDEFKKGFEAIAGGKQINFEGASGKLIFDKNGDRPSQGMRTFTPNADASDWIVKDNYDADLKKK